VGSTSPFTDSWIGTKGNVAANTLNFQKLKPDKYQLWVKDKYGCEVKSEVIDLTKVKDRVLQVPNSISPNGDGVNDTWKINGAENHPEAEFSVFNRLGNRLFHSKGYAKEFNGTYNGKPLPAGVYYFVIDMKTDCGKISGSLTIIR
jgi:gliding motility-associated-like protein